MPTRKDLETGETVSASPPSRQRLAIAQAFTYVEDFVYLSLAVLLSACAGLALVNGTTAFWEILRAGSVLGIVSVLDRLLLVLMIIELLYTVKVSFREHALTPEPFLIVGLIAVTRRVLVVTAQLAVLLEKPERRRFPERDVRAGAPDRHGPGAGRVSPHAPQALRDAGSRTRMKREVPVLGGPAGFALLALAGALAAGSAPAEAGQARTSTAAAEAEQARTQTCGAVVRAAARRREPRTPPPSRGRRPSRTRRRPPGSATRACSSAKLEDWLRPALERCVQDAPEGGARSPSTRFVRVSAEGKAEEDALRARDGRGPLRRPGVSRRRAIPRRRSRPGGSRSRSASNEKARRFRRALRPQFAIVAFRAVYRFGPRGPR